MDTSETYIKMCEKAEEIQKRWRTAAYQEQGDGYGSLISYFDEANKRQRLDMFLGFYTFDGKPTTQIISLPSRYSIAQTYAGLIWQHDLTKVVWLPRQDQLQEMVGGFEAGMIDWWHWRNAVYPHMQNPHTKEWRFNSFEQLWLAFVMKEKYGKVWNGEEWVKN